MFTGVRCNALVGAIAEVVVGVSVGGGAGALLLGSTLGFVCRLVGESAAERRCSALRVASLFGCATHRVVQFAIQCSPLAFRASRAPPGEVPAVLCVLQCEPQFAHRSELVGERRHVVQPP